MPDQESPRVPPHNAEAESAVLGAMLLRPEAADRALAELRPEDFYNPANQRIFAAMRSLANAGTPIDIVTVSARMETEGTLHEGGFEYLNRLVEDLLSAGHIDQHIRLIREKSALRQLISICVATAQDGYAGQTPSETLIARAADEIYKIAVGNARGQVMPIREAVLQSYQQMSVAFKSKGGILGIPTGFPLMDQMLSGLQPTQLIVIAGRPGMGKTSFALNIVEHASMQQQATCLVFSMEMSAEQLATRLLCSNAQVDMQKTRTGRMQVEDFNRMGTAMKRISAAPIFIDDSAGITVSEMTAKARRLQRNEGLGMIVIDYLQLMSAPDRRTENRNQEISHITRSLKIMAKELNVPIVLLSQLSRASERSDAGKYPKLSELRESGAIEQDADVVIFLQRDDYYAENRTEDNIGKATILIAKQRNGPTGPINVRWSGEFTRYMEVDPTHAEDDAPENDNFVYEEQEVPF